MGWGALGLSGYWYSQPGRDVKVDGGCVQWGWRRQEGQQEPRHVSVKYPGVCWGTTGCLGLERLKCEAGYWLRLSLEGVVRAACVLEEGLLLGFLDVFNFQGSVSLVNAI